MVSFASLVSLIPIALALTGSASAATIGSRQDSDPKHQYYLRTSNLDGKFDNLYLYGVNIDAGVKSALLSESRSSAIRGELKGGYQWFDYGVQYQYGLNMNEDTMVAGMVPYLHCALPLIQLQGTSFTHYTDLLRTP